MLEVYKNILTAAGADLHARSIAGEKMQITKFALGNGAYTGTETDDAIRKMTALKSQKNSYGVSAVETISESTCKITMIATNEGITEGYYVTELGIFAAGADGKEVLYSIIVADPAKPDWMSAYNAVAPSSLRYYNFISVGNAANVTVTPTSGAVALQEDLDAVSDKLNKLMANNALLDGTPERYKAVMKMFFEANGVNAMTAAGLTELCDKWYTMTRTTWNGWTAFWQPDLSSSSDGTKGGDNAGLICEPSTNTYAGQDDYAGNPLFACIDCNWIVDADTLEPMITAIDGVTDGFERYNPDKLVGVLQQSGWHWYDEKETQYIHGYSGTYQSGHDYCEPLPEAVRVSDNSMRPWVVHSKYMSHEVDGKMTSYSGVAPTAETYSHNTLHTKSAVNGAQYSGGCVTDGAFLVLMTFIKYGSMTQSDKLQGCLNYSFQYYAQVAETGVKRVLLRPSEAANLIVGSNILIGTYSDSSAGRSDALNYAISGADGCRITAIETVTVNGTTYSAVYVDTDTTFDTTYAGDKAAGTTLISTWHWNNGSCDDVLGNDGAPASPAGGKYPVKIQGIEHIVGGYEVYADVILNLYKDTDDAYYYEPYMVRKSVNQATSITANYVAAGLKSAQATPKGWKYIRKLGFAKGVFFGTDTTGGSSSAYTRDAFYKEAGSAGAREWLSFGGLYRGSNGGLSALDGAYGLSYSTWGVLARLSPNGNRGEWAA